MEKQANHPSDHTSEREDPVEAVYQHLDSVTFSRSLERLKRNYVHEESVVVTLTRTLAAS